MVAADLVIKGASEVRTCDPDLGEGPTGLIRDGALACAGEEIVWVGPKSRLSLEVDTTEARIIEAEGRAVVPGFVDPHTHLVFAGSRAEEFAARAAGQPYEAGGINKTVAATKAASTDELIELAMARADTMLLHGTTTAEAKSGYALDLEGERRLLEVLGEVHARHTLDLEITFCGAHAIPEDYEGRADEFIDDICEMTPKLAPLASWVDVFCDVGAFDPEQSKRALLAGKDAGLTPRIHANELAASGGVGVAVEVGAATADHLLYVSEEEASAMAASDVVAVLAPSTALGLGRFPDVAMFRDKGVKIALASDLNPGSAYGENIQFAVDIATRAMGMGPEEALLAITATSAYSLRRDDIGRLAPGCLADVVVLDAETALDLGYHASVNLAGIVLKRGKVAQV